MPISLFSLFHSSDDKEISCKFLKYGTIKASGSRYAYARSIMSKVLFRLVGQSKINSLASY